MLRCLFTIFILTSCLRFSVGQESNDTLPGLFNRSVIYDAKKEGEKEMKLYIDSLNIPSSKKVPNFIFDECFDSNKFLWKTLHSPVSLRWEVLEKVTNKEALKAILDTNDLRLKKKCEHLKKEESVYPYMVVPLIEVCTYDLVLKRYRQLAYKNN